MTGMKEGAGEDPFADEENTNSSSEDALAPEPGRSRTQGDNRREESSRSESTQGSGQDNIHIPYKFRRDGVQDGRDRVPLFLQEDTKRSERDALRELEERFDDDVSLTDLREALVKTGLEHLDQVEEELEEWGYGMTFNE